MTFYTATSDQSHFFYHNSAGTIALGFKLTIKYINEHPKTVFFIFCGTEEDFWVGTAAKFNDYLFIFFKLSQRKPITN